MKSSKSAKVKPKAPEGECGIWLDTKELKERKQQKQLTRPISRLLNPLSRSGYGVAVALNFTQTKLNMPVTRQSTISAFFSTKTRETNTGAKRKHGSLESSIESTNHTSDTKQQDGDGDFAGLSANDKKRQHFLHLICGDELEEEEPPEKRRHVALYTHQNVLETQECWNKETQNEAFFHWESQNHKLEPFRPSPDPKNTHKHVLGDQKVKRSVLTSVNENLKTHDCDFTKNQNKASPMKRMGKENIWPLSPIKSPSSSQLKAKVVSSPPKCRLKEKYAFSPNRMSGQEDDALSALFTQDSEGFCVIAHREQHLRSPGKERDLGKSPFGVFSEEESDPEMLFTQDSEGNTVIKH